MVLSICKIEEESEAIVIKFRNDSNNEITYRRLPFNNYFFIKEKDYTEIEFICKNDFLDVFDVTTKDGEYKKLILKNNWHRNIIRNKIEDEGVLTYEADIDSKKRFILEHPELLNQENLKAAFIDIETDDREPLEREGFRGQVIAQSPILSAAIKDLKTGETTYFRNKAAELNDLDNIELHEKNMLIQYFNYIKDYDVCFAWYGWGFDFPYLKQRAEKYDIKYDKLFMVDIDYKEVYEKYLWGSIKNKKLETVSMHELGSELEKENTKFEHLADVKKLDWKEITGEKKYYDLWKNHPKILKEYNIQDVNLMYMIEQKLNYFSLMAATSKLCNCLLGDVVFNSRAIDNILIKRYHENNMLVISKPTQKQIEDRQSIFVSGGFTYTKRGIYDNAYCFDFASHYVKTAMDTFNISPENLIGFKEPILEIIFNDEEIKFIRYCENVTTNFVAKDGKFQKDKYLKHIEEYRIENKYNFTMEDLMWRFSKQYRDEALYNWCVEKNYSFTPADINLDTRGWKVHRNRIFKRERGILSQFANDLSVERDAIKYNMMTFEYHSPEWWENEMAQLGIKTVGNSAYGVMALKMFRFFNYDIADAITTTCRAITKKTILRTKKLGYESPFGDTDSAYILGIKSEEEKENLNKEYIEFYKNIAKLYNLGNKIMINFEYEKHFEKVIVSTKKKYYYKYLKEGKALYDTAGGYYKKIDSFKIAADEQFDLCKDILDENFNVDNWKNRILKLKEKVYDFKLEEEHIKTVKVISKDLSEYGLAMMDSKTGKQKITKDGNLRFASIPCHIKIAKDLLTRGHDIQKGDAIEYVIKESKPRQVGLWIEDFRLNPEYDADYIWEKIESPIIEILNIKCPELLYTHFKECWHFTERQIKSLINKLDLEED